MRKRARRTLGAGLAAAAASTALAATAQDAQAAFTLPQCGGATFALQGSSFQNTAQTVVWPGVYGGSNGCNDASKNPTYRSSSSGNGLASMGAGGGSTSGTNAPLCVTAGTCTTPLASGFRDPNGAGAATDEPPTPTQQAAMDAGPSTGTGDDALVHVVPVATGSSTVVVHVPEGCSFNGVANLTGAATGTAADGTTDTATDNTRRIRIPNALLEKVFAGASDADTWGEVVGTGITGTPTSAQETGITDCAQVPVKRVVRSDNSGTTYAFKAFLKLINPGRGWDSTLATTTVSGVTTNAFWPAAGAGSGTSPTAITASSTPSNVCPNTEANKLCGASGGGGVRDVVNTTDGAIGYVDLATARGFFTVTPSTTSPDPTYWIPLQNNPGGTATTYVEPTFDPTAHKPNFGSKGANCAGVPVTNAPTKAASPNGDPTLGDWSKAFAAGGAGYPNCVLTYVLAWDDSSKAYGTSDTEQAKARGVKDYLQLAVLSSFGQAFVGQDYSALPNPTSQPLLDIARGAAATATAPATGVAAIDWQKTVDGGGGPTTTTDTTTTTPPTTTGGGGTTPPPATTTQPTPTTTVPIVVPPVQTVPSNAFSFTKSTNKKNKSISLKVKVPGAGKLGVTGSYKDGKKTLKLSAFSTTVSSAGTKQVTITLSTKAKAALRKARKKGLKVTLKVQFTPTGGTAKTTTTSVTVK